MSNTPRGVRTIGEQLLRENRALIVTNQNKDDLLKIWSQLPDGTIHVDPVTGINSTKIAGRSTWTPYGIDAEKTMVVSRDTQFNEETFIIKSIDKAAGTFSYENAKGDKTHSVCLNSGKEFVFVLEKGSYMMGRNHLEVTLDDCLIRTVMSGGIQEISDLKFKVMDELVVGQKVTVRYVKWTKIGNPYPRFFLGAEEPESADLGDFWLDPNGELDENSAEDELEDNPEATISWSRITGTPTTLAGYGVTEKYSAYGHVHRTLDISDFPTSLPAKGGDSSTVRGLEPKNAPGQIPVLDSNAKLSTSVLPNNYLIQTGAIYIQDAQPTNPAENAIWICTGSSRFISVYRSATGWLKVASL